MINLSEFITDTGAHVPASQGLGVMAVSLAT
jgi:hypothetical protein